MLLALHFILCQVHTVVKYSKKLLVEVYIPIEFYVDIVYASVIMPIIKSPLTSWLLLSTILFSQSEWLIYILPQGLKSVQAWQIGCLSEGQDGTVQM